MQFTHSPEQDGFSVTPDDVSLSSLLARGLRCFEQGVYAEGTALLRLAREQLSSDQLLLVTALNALDKAMMSHLQAQRVLHEASKRFAESDSEQQAQMAALKKLLPDTAEDTLPAFPPVTQEPKTPGDNESLQLPALPVTKAETCEKHNGSSGERHTLPALYITCFSRFEVRYADASSSPLRLCSNVKGQTILRYLITQPRHRATVDILMAALWPEEAPEEVEHKLRVAVSALRCSLNRNVVRETGGGYILCKDQVYQLNPAVQLHCDVDNFLALYAAGQKSSDGKTRAAYYEQACALYSGPFLVEDMYAEWSYFRREELLKTYVIMCDTLAEYNLQSQHYEAAAQWASAILQVDCCDEEAYRQLIRAYVAQGRRGEAIRQYKQCQRVLSKELGMQPAPETQKLFQLLVNGTDASSIEEETRPCLPSSQWP